MTDIAAITANAPTAQPSSTAARRCHWPGLNTAATAWCAAAAPGVRIDTSVDFLRGRAPAAQVARVLATVVATAGSTYRKPGARMLIMADGSHLGLLSGGCLEADLKLHAQEVLESGVPRAIEYDMRGPDDILFGIGAGCEGAMRVLLEPAGPRRPPASTAAAAGRPTQAGRPAPPGSVHEPPGV